MLDTTNWKETLIVDLFHIEYGNKLDKCKMSENMSSGIAFISRSEKNNGIDSYVDEINGVEPYESGNLTVALGGSIGSTNLQLSRFYTAQNVAVLIPKYKISNNVKLFIKTLIENEAKAKFCAFGRELNSHIKKDLTIKIPYKNNQPDFDLMDAYMNSLNILKPSTKNKANKTINTDNWFYFRIGDLFTLSNGKNKSAGDLVDGDEISYIGAKKLNNGVMKKCIRDESVISNGNCIVFICNGEGSVGYANYMDKDIIASSDLVLGYNENLNKYNGLFISTVASLERPKYSFGRKWKTHLADTIIKLPSKSVNNKNVPDWIFMEKYIKDLPYGDVL